MNYSGFTHFCRSVTSHNSWEPVQNTPHWLTEQNWKSSLTKHSFQWAQSTQDCQLTIYWASHAPTSTKREREKRSNATESALLLSCNPLLTGGFLGFTQCSDEVRPGSCGTFSFHFHGLFSVEDSAETFCSLFPKKISLMVHAASTILHSEYFWDLYSSPLVVPPKLSFTPISRSNNCIK